MKPLTFLSIALVSSFCFAQQDDSKPKLSETDQLQIEVQKICPVMGAELGSMGQPIKVKFGEQNLFLCCKGCIGKQAKPEHWKKIHVNIAAAQGTCPIMEKPVTAEMKSTVVQGQKIFVCCPPCIEKIQSAPDDNLKKVRASYVAFVTNANAANSDQLMIAAQQICPVTGKKLGSMGAPVKVNVGGQHAFLCCKGCTGEKIKVEHWKTIQQNLAKAQATCPVMGKPVDAKMKSTTVNGRKFFVCCPPCIDKIKAEPAKFVAQLDQQYEKSLSKK